MAAGLQARARPALETGEEQRKAYRQFDIILVVLMFLSVRRRRLSIQQNSVQLVQARITNVIVNGSRKRWERAVDRCIRYGSLRRQ
jgi:hypothetical protein